MFIHFFLKGIISGINDGDGSIVALHLLLLICAHMLKHISLIFALGYNRLDKLDERRLFGKRALKLLLYCSSALFVQFTI
jgi:hypothetical protein